MSKKQLLLLTCVSTLALVGPTAFAEDVVPVDPTTPSTEVTTPSTPVDTGLPSDTTDPNTPVEPETPTNPTNPSTPIDPGTPTDTTTPTDDTTTPGTSTSPTDPKPETPIKPEVPSTVTPEVIDHVDPSNGSVTIKPVPIVPGKAIIGTQNGQLIVQDYLGKQSVESATTYGGRVNDNGTVTIKDVDGKEKTLPSTGEKASVLTYVGMALTTILALVFKNKKLQ
ncbi:cell wall anchor protein [Streptococcus iniae]|uniref:Cell wall anchor protein n=1 Tax=Streptococcus iniae TaxID=1346 RepID=A0A3L8GE00_STRIN|nr:LPXTG cell wall anchor domain-containing protein [Streptococcus iniae]RLU51761.1 cell wall anchor protein [Streptococcus iniae]RLU54884.1 cell wall anchor protein [Streptococcus iniae]